MAIEFWIDFESRGGRMNVGLWMADRGSTCQHVARKISAFIAIYERTTQFMGFSVTYTNCKWPKLDALEVSKCLLH